MQFDIRVAALHELTLKRVKMAATLLAAYGARARVSAWDGTRCHLLVAAGDDAYGQRALALAERRATPALTVLDIAPVDASTTVGRDTPAAHLVKMFSQLLGLADTSESGPSEIALDSLVCLLAGPRYRGQLVTATRGSAVVMLDPGAGKVYAASHSDLLHVQDRLCEGDWTVWSGNPRRFPQENGAAAGMEPFLIAATQRGKAALPAFPAGPCWLETWPDLGCLPSMLKLMQLTRMLTREATTPHALAEKAGDIASVQEVNAFLWALSAANLLKLEAKVVESKAPRRRTVGNGIWTAIARRFGLSQKSI